MNEGWAKGLMKDEGWANEWMKDEQMNDHNYEEWREGISL